MLKNRPIIPMTEEHIPVIAGFYEALARGIEKETGDIYFAGAVIDSAILEANLRESLNQSDIVTFIAISDVVPVGFISGGIIDNFYPFSPIRKVGYLSAAYVMPSHRRKGFMRELENRLTQYFIDNAVKYVELFMLSDNESARRTWVSLGYKTFRESMRKNISQ